ncbi:MAG: type I DNA topoisomerase [Candidatus Muiribacteriota bacterium]
MPKKLLIVESPGKIKTLEKILGKDYVVKASKGHIRDLPKKKFGIKIDKKNFEAEYQIMPDKKKVVEELTKFSNKGYDILYAPDPDREGEAIAWHLLKILGGSEKDKCRVVFNAITPSEVNRGIENPSYLDKNKVDAQQSRRILDRIVGYKLSPFLWRKVDRGLSAGRVQSVALLLVVEREKEIEKFEPEEYFIFTADFNAEKIKLKDTKLIEVDNVKLPKIDLNKEKAEEFKKKIEASKNKFEIKDVKNKKKRVSSPKPFITSTLQQEASRIIGFSAKKTMMVAQSLYEGKSIKGENYGLITYMRTDSTRISSEGISMGKKFIESNYGKEFYGGPKVKKTAKNKKTVQDAHEAIRPAYVQTKFSPEEIESFLKPDEKKLYKLIWNRFIASLMKPAIYDVEDIYIWDGDFVFNVKYEKIDFPGYQIIYKKEDDTIKQKELIKIKKGDKTELEKVKWESKFTQPPARYSEASLIRKLEKEGIGRPSTYATIVNTIVERKYVNRIKKQLFPTNLGIVVNHIISSTFKKIINIKFTAGMEENLDLIESGKQKYQKVIKDFFFDFEKELEKAKDKVAKTAIETDIKCEKCKSNMTLKFHGKQAFLACPKYPDCKNTMSLPPDEKLIPADYQKETKLKLSDRKEEFKKEAEKAKQSIETDEECEKCGSKMVIKSGRFGKFKACSGYPKCKNTKPILEDIGVDCPDGCGGKVVIKKSKRGKRFYSCSNYPKCKFASFDVPTEEKCKKCGKTKFKKSMKAEKTYCKNKECKS